MNLKSLSINAVKKYGIPVLLLIAAFIIQSCSTFTYKTYINADTTIVDPEPNYNLTLNPFFQEYTSFMFIGNRVENFSTYFNTFFNAEDDFSSGYDLYISQILSNYSENLDSVNVAPKLSQEATDDFNNAIEKASKVIQYHKSSAFMDRAVLLIGKTYYFLGDYLKAERKFSEFISKLSASPLVDEASLYYARTQMRLKDYQPALNRLDDLIKNSKDKSIVANAYQTLAEYSIAIGDYDNAIKNYAKSIELSNDSDFKAQMQFLLATLIARTDPSKGAAEYNKVLDFSTSFDLEYLSRFNHLKYLILGNEFTGVSDLLDNMRVKYKDNPDYVSSIELLSAKYYEQKKDYKNAIEGYRYVIMNFARTVASSDACYALGSYYEKVTGDYLTAYKYYKLSGEESAAGHNSRKAAERMNIFKTYFDLRSVITGKKINTDNDSSFINFQRDKLKKGQENQQDNEGQNKGKGDEGGQPGSLMFYSDSIKQSGDLLDNQLPKDTSKIKKDTLLQTSETVDSAKIREENITKAKFELAELFLYSLNKPDSAVEYLDEAYDQSGDYDFKAKVLFTLGNLYKSLNEESKSEDIFKNIIDEYPLSPLANSSRRILNRPIEETVKGTVDSIFLSAESRFVSRNYMPALEDFINIITNYPSSKYYARSNYAAGWIYENVLDKPDSAYTCYNNIVQSDPKSALVPRVSGKILEYQKFIAEKSDTLKNKADTLNDITDTLKTKDTLNVKQPGIQDGTGTIPNSGENNGIEQEKKQQNGDMKKEGDETGTPGKK